MTNNKPNSGSGIISGAIKSTPLKICPKCEGLNLPDAKVCPNCQYKF